MAEPLLFDARIEELVRELARDPRSSLLRVPRPARLGVVLERAPLVGVATAGLTAVEEELVRVHRAELAYLLRKLCVVRLFESPNAPTARVRTNFASQPLEIERAPLVTHVEQFLVEHPLEAKPHSPEELLLACVRTPGRLDAVPVTALAAAANKLDPTDQARIYAAQWMGGDEGDLQGARALLEAVLDLRPSPANASMAATNLGRYCSLGGDLSAALRWYQQSAQLVPSNAVGAFSWLIAAIECLDASASRRAAEHIDNSFAVDEPAAREFATMLRAQKAIGSLSVSRDAEDLARRSTAQYESCSRVIADAFVLD